MEWAWSWWVFVPALIFFSLLNMMARGASNETNIVKYGRDGDYRQNMPGAMMAAIVFGIIFAAIVTVGAGFFI